MSVTEVRKDPAARSMTITSEFDAPVERVWRLWADPRRLERWWGPPTHPATVTGHDLSAGGRVVFFMTAPDGERRDGEWSVVHVEPPRALEFDLSTPGFPTVRIRVRLEERPGGASRMEIETRFPDDAAMELMVGVGMDWGMSAALGQADALLAEAD